MDNIGWGVTPPSFALLVALLSEVWNNYSEERVEVHDSTEKHQEPEWPALA
jgi:hypothetical protein